MKFWKNKRVLLTGGAGFLGSYIVRKLKEKGCKNIFIPYIEDYDLVKMEDVKRAYRNSKPDIVIHLAAKVGGIEANRGSPGSFFYDNLMMGGSIDGSGEAGESREIRGSWNNLRLS